MGLDKKVREPYRIRNYIGDAPNPGDIELIQRNLERVLKIQDDYYRRKAKQMLGVIRK